MEGQGGGSMKAWRLIALGLFVALASAGCGDATGPDAVPQGGYAYTGFDEDGTVVVQGWLTLDTHDPAHVTGTWHLEPVGNVPNLGPQTGDGRLTGQAQGNALVIDLNPGFADNNVVLDGRLGDGTYDGRWTYSGFAGPVGSGTFTADVR